MDKVGREPKNRPPEIKAANRHQNLIDKIQYLRLARLVFVVCLQKKRQDRMKKKRLRAQLAKE